MDWSECWEFTRNFLVLGAIWFVVFCLLRKVRGDKIRDRDWSRLRRSAPYGVVQALEHNGWFDWLATARVPDEAYKRQEIRSYLRFHRICLFASGLGSLCGLLVVVPANLYFSRKDETFLARTVTNKLTINTFHTALLFASTCVVVGILVVCILSLTEDVRGGKCGGNAAVSTLRWAVATPNALRWVEAVATPSALRCVVMIYNLPERTRDAYELEATLERNYGATLYHAHVCFDFAEYVESERLLLDCAFMCAPTNDNTAVIGETVAIGEGAAASEAAKELEQGFRKMSELACHARNIKSTKCAFAVFPSAASAARILKRFSGRDGVLEGSAVIAAPNPTDIVWEHLLVSNVSKSFRIGVFALLTCVAVMILVVVVPATVALLWNTVIRLAAKSDGEPISDQGSFWDAFEWPSAQKTIPEESRSGPSLLGRERARLLTLITHMRNASDAYHFLVTFVIYLSRWCQTISLVLVNSLLLPLLINCASAKCGFWFRSSFVTLRYCSHAFFLLINTLLIPLAAGSWSTIVDVYGAAARNASFSEWVKQLGASLTQHSFFFTARYILDCTFILLIVDGLRLSCIFARIRPQNFDFAYNYACLTAMLCVAFVVSVIMPLALPCAFSYFFCKYYIDKYNFLFALWEVPQTCNAVIDSALVSAYCGCLLLFLVAMCGYFFVLGRHWLGLLLLLSFLITLMASLHVNARVRADLSGAKFEPRISLLHSRLLGLLFLSPYQLLLTTARTAAAKGVAHELVGRRVEKEAA